MANSAAQLLYGPVFVFVTSGPLTSPLISSQTRTNLKSILNDLIWLKVLRNSCTVPYLYTFLSLLTVAYLFKTDVTCYLKWEMVRQRDTIRVSILGPI